MMAEIEAACQKAIKNKSWYPWIFESAANGYLVCTGAVCPPITRGKNKGRPNYKRADPATKAIVVIRFKKK